MVKDNGIGGLKPNISEVKCGFGDQLKTRSYGREGLKEN